MTGEDVANRDLWERLVGLVNEHAHLSLEVYFMHVPRHFNEEADRLAKIAAERTRYVRYCPADLAKDESDPW